MDSFFTDDTDTGVGKTVLSLVLMQYLYHCGANPAHHVGNMSRLLRSVRLALYLLQPIKTVLL